MIHQRRHSKSSSATAPDPLRQLQQMLKPLSDAGWKPVAFGDKHRSQEQQEYGYVSETLRRSCLVIDVAYFPDQTMVHFEQALPVAEPAVLEKLDPHNGLALSDAINGQEPVKVLAAEASDLPGAVEQAAGRLGLLDPTRFAVGQGSSATTHDLFARQYLTYVAMPAVRWHWPDLPRRRALRLLDTDPAFTNQLRWLSMYAPNVVPDPVPMTAAIGLTLACWRNTLLETIHASPRAEGGHGLTDVVMAKLNITTTRGLRAFITTAGIHWEQVNAYLASPERTLPDGRTVGELVGRQWPEVQRDIEDHLATWRHLEALLGPEPILRLLSATGSTAMTCRWWGNSWWPVMAGTVLAGLDWQHIPELRDYGDAEGLELLSALQNQPETLPDEVLVQLMDPPEGLGSGLRVARVPKRPVKTLQLE